jgi:HEPN domain-containing protein
MPEATEDWIRFAENDFEAALILFNNTNRSLYSNVCYNCQQSIEKFLKALLVKNNLEVERTHRLARLVDLLIPIYPQLHIHREALIILTNYATDSRYPGEMIVTRKRATDALELASDLRQVLKQLLEVE